MLARVLAPGWSRGAATSPALSDDAPAWAACSPMLPSRLCLVLRPGGSGSKRLLRKLTRRSPRSQRGSRSAASFRVLQAVIHFVHAAIVLAKAVIVEECYTRPSLERQ